MNKFFEAVANVFKIPDLRKRVLFTLGLLAVYRFGAHVPVPGIDGTKLESFFQQNAGGFLGLFDTFSGGMMRRLTVFALGIMPYITASIILQLMTVVVPALEKMQKEGELGRRKITQWTRYLTVILAFFQSVSIAIALQNVGGGFVVDPGIRFIFTTMVSLTAGTAFIMWLGEQISERGIGNGMSLIIFAGIVRGLPDAMADVMSKLRTGTWGVLHIIVIGLVMLAVMALIIFVERGERRIPIQYAKRVVGRRMMGGQSTHLPLKVNAGGVIPVIFASSLLAIPVSFVTTDFVRNSGWLRGILESIGHGQVLYFILYTALILFFCFFYISIIFNPNEAADNMRKYGGFIPGIRPGRPTADYMNKILTRITMVGGLYLAVLSIIPEVMIGGVKLQKIPGIGNWIDSTFPRWLLDGLGVTFYFGGTSLLIVVGVAMDLVNQVEAQLIMRHYEGFTPRAGRIRGRRGVF
ncbi:MAG: preprotein translocase subunit SecY [Bryobacteraceae bacterium]